MSTSIRLVRCPRCRKILPELPNIPVYKCGGCGTTLRAKKHQNDINGRAQSRRRYEPSIVSNSSREGDHPSIESLPGSEPGREPFKSRTHILEKRVDTDFSDEHSRSTRPDYRHNMLSLEPNESAVQGERGRLLEKYAGPRKIESLEHSSEKSHDRTSDEIFGSCDSFLEYEDLSEEIIISRKKDEERYSRKLNVIASVNEIKDSRGALADKERCSGETQSLDDPETTRSSESELKLVVAKDPQNNGNGIEKYTNDIEDSQGELSREGKNSTEPQSSNKAATQSSVDEPLKLDDENEPSSEDNENSEADTSPTNPRVPMAPLSPDDIYQGESPEIGPSFHRISSEEMLDTSPINPSVPSAPLSPDDTYLEESPEVGPSFHRISSEERVDTSPLNPRVSFAPFSPNDIYLEGSAEVGPNFHRVSSDEMLDTLPINPRVPAGSMSKSPTRAYYAGDESEYSYDGTQELSAHVSHPYSRKVKGTGTRSTNRFRQKIGFRVKNKQTGEQDWRRHESPEPRNHTHEIRTWMTAANNEPISRVSYMPRRSQLLQGNRSPASATQNVLMHNGEFSRHDTIIGSDPEKVELLRMVHELEDKINRTQMSKPISGERLPSRDVREEIRTGGYYDDLPTGRNPYVDFKYSGHHRSDPKGVGWANHPRRSKPVFSGEASQCRSHIDCRCSHCYHQDMHISPKLSSHCVHCQYAAHPRDDYENIYPSYYRSPQNYSSSQFSHEIPADPQKNDHEMKMLYLREKQQVVKRHLRPVSGGAPIVDCYNCSELLQLPADFLLFKKRCHQLRCSSCNMILKFSILKKSHLVPYVLKIQAPLPSKMGNYSNIVGSSTLASTSQAINPQDAEPVSFSDEPVPSSSRNGSTESGASVPSSSHVINYKKTLSVMEVYGMSISPRHNIEVGGPSSSTATRVKPSSEIEELPAAPGSPLHRLMGYESARHVLFPKSKDDSDDGMGFYMDRQIR